MLRVGTSVICPISVVVIEFEWSTRKKNQEKNKIHHSVIQVTKRPETSSTMLDQKIQR